MLKLCEPGKVLYPISPPRLRPQTHKVLSGPRINPRQRCQPPGLPVAAV